MTRKYVWLARTAATILFIVALVAALCTALLLPYFFALWLANIPLLTFISFASFFLIVWFGVRLCARIWGATRGVRFATQAAGVLTLVFAISLYWLILKPTADLGSPRPYDNTRYWQLSTGSHIGYSEFDPPPGMTVNPIPIVFLHGGPGVRQGPFDQSIYGGLSKEGFRVFLYDQAGSGLSDFLPNVRDYTLGRSVEDLEAVRKEIGADKMILIGHSWGSTLAVNYMSEYPGHVSKLILHSPGDIWNWGPNDEYGRSDFHGSAFPGWRLFSALWLAYRNPDAAQNLVSQRELEGLSISVLGDQLSTVVCKGNSNRLPKEIAAMQAAHENPGINSYVRLNIQLDGEDPHAALRSDHTPAILLYPECNFIPWSGAVDYRRTMPNLKIYYIPHAGHYIQFEQPELMRQIMVAFLLDKPDVIAPVETDKDPRG